MHESSIEIGALDNKSKVIPLVLGPLLALALYFILPETYISAKGDVTQLSHAARACVSMVLWMAIWWFTEAVPIAVTALLPIVCASLSWVLQRRLRRSRNTPTIRSISSWAAS